MSTTKISALILAAALTAPCLLPTADCMAQAIAVGLAGRAMPSRLTVDSLRWDDEVVAAALVRCPIARGTTYYFSNSGNDSTGNGSLATPWATIAKAQTTLTASSGNVALLFKRGDTFTVNTGLNVDKDNVTVGAYGTGARPLFNAFVNTLASGGTLWTQAGGTNRYTASVASDIGGIREQLNRFKVYRKVATTGEVESTANSYYWASGTLHVHATNAAGSAVDPDTIAYEYTLASATDDSGVDVLAGSDSVRVDSIRCDGWGLDGGTANQEYGVKVQATGTDVAVVTGCGAYYCARHCMGHNPGLAASGGLVIWIGNDTGYCTEAAASPFVSYAGQGAWEDIYLANTTAFGALPLNAGRAWADGIAVYAHTDSDSYRFGLLLVKDHIVRAPANGFGCHTGVQFANAPTATGPADCRAVVINTTLERAVGTGANGSAGSGQNFCLPNSLEIGGSYRLVPLNMLADAIGVVAPSGWCIGTSVEIDLTNAGMTEDQYSLYSAGSSTTNPKYWHCAFHVISNGTTDFALPLRAAWDTAAVPDVEGEFVSSLFAVSRPNPATSTVTIRALGDVIRMGVNNSATRIRNSAFYNDTVQGTYIGRSNAVGSVELDAMPTFGAAVYTGARQLVGAGEGGMIEFDALLRSRHPTAPSIGPVEFVAQELQRPTAAELVALIEAGDVGEIASYLPATGPLASSGQVDGVEGGLSDLAETIGTPSGADLVADVLSRASAASVAALSPVTSQPRVNYRAGPAYRLRVSNRSDGTHRAIEKVRLRPGAIQGDGIAVELLMDGLYGTTNVQGVSNPVVSGGSLTATALGPRDTAAMVVLDGTATASEKRTVTVDVEMATGEVEQVTFDVWVLAD